MTEHKSFVFTFADVEIREREFCIVKAGRVLSVEPKAFRVLLFLVRNPHRLIGKDELLDAVWKDSAVTENSLTRSIALLRRLLGDDTREPRYIATVHTVGYRFLCDVEVTEDGFEGLETAESHLVNSRNELEPPRGTNGDRVSPDHPQIQTAAADQVEEKVEEPSDRRARLPKKLLVPGSIAAALIILVTGFFVHRAIRDREALGNAIRRADKTTASSRMHFVPLTTLPGKAWGPAFSPDGEKIAFIWDGENPVKGDLYVQLVGGERPLRLTHTSSGYICCADWSPDGRHIVFGRCDDSGGGVFTVPALGGPERKLTEVVCHIFMAGYPKWIGNGRSLLIVDRCVPDGPGAIVVFSLETGEKRCLTDPPRYIEPGDILPTLSPDGKTVAFNRMSTPNLSELYTVELSGGNLRQLTHEGSGVWNLMWSSDGQHIIFIFNSGRAGLGRVWRVPAAGGSIEPETIYPATGALSRDGRRLAYLYPMGEGSWEIWRTALSSPGGQVVSQNRIIESAGWNSAPQPSPDGQQIVLESCRGQCAVWKTAADGSNPLQMTFFDKGLSGTPRWSPDGKWIAFDHRTPTHTQIYLIDSEGRNQHLVASGDYENSVPGWSRDGTAIYFASNRTGSWQVWRHNLATGRETQVTHHGGFAAFESYDAKTIYYSKFEGGGIWSIPVGGGEEKQITDALHRGYWGHFAVTDAGLYLLDADASPRPTVMFYSFQTRLLTPVMPLEKSPIVWTASLAASRDGRTVFIAQGVFHTSIAMVENFQ